MATTYVRRFNLKDSLSDAEVGQFWRFVMDEFVPAGLRISGVQCLKLYSGAGALRADLRIVAEMDDAGVYERILDDPQIRSLIGRFYGAMDLSTSTQAFIREVTPELIQAIGGSS